MNESNISTPRTDDLVACIERREGRIAWAIKDIEALLQLASQLERELAEARQMAKELAEAMSKVSARQQRISSPDTRWERRFN